MTCCESKDEVTAAARAVAIDALMEEPPEDDRRPEPIPMGD